MSMRSWILGCITLEYYGRYWACKNTEPVDGVKVGKLLLRPGESEIATHVLWLLHAQKHDYFSKFLWKFKKTEEYLSLPGRQLSSVPLLVI